MRLALALSPALLAACSSGAGAHLQSGGILVSESTRITIVEVSLGPAQNRGGGGNGHLFEVQRSREILSRDSVGASGLDRGGDLAPASLDEDQLARRMTP